MSLLPPSDDEYDSHHAIWLRAVVAELPLGGLFLELHNGYRGRAERRAYDLLEEVATRVDARLMRERLQGSEQLESVFWRSMRSAAESTHAGKRRLLAQALANAILEQASVDETEILVGVLASIDTPHIVALARLSQAESEAREVGDLPDRSEHAERPLVKRLYEAGEREHSLVLGVLATQGLIDMTSGFGDGEARFRGVTKYGATLLEDLRANAG